MTPPADIGWVEPAKPIRGLDHLGVQAPCIALYTQLLPGITNVTDRARYYSFHPWLIRSFERRYSDHSIVEFRRVLRRAECLFALIAIRHARITGDDDAGRHGAGMVGRFTLLRIPEDEKAIRLDDYAGFDGPKRYFKNRLGGLGQYYFGPLRDLRVLDHTSQGDGALPGYDKVRGAALAEALGAAVAEDGFFDLLEASQFHWFDLDGLVEFCPCNLQTSDVERNLLLDLFLVRSDQYQSPESTNRRASLLLALDLVNRCSPLEGYSPEGVFRASTYGRSLPDGTPWEVAPSLSKAQRGWTVYQQNELFSLAHLDQVRDLSGEPDHVGEPVVDRLQHGPVSSGWTVFRPAAGEPVVDRLQHRSSSSKRRKPSAHERTEHHVPPGDVDLPGLWTPAHRRAESGGRRGGRPQAVGNLAGERRRPCLRAGREIPTVPQRIIIIDNRVRTGLVPTMAAAGQCRSGGR